MSLEAEHGSGTRTARPRFCARCGHPLDEQAWEGHRRPLNRCGSCGFQMYLNPRPTGNTVILSEDGDRFLALLRARDPQAGRWGIPGGFCDGWEDPAAAAVREADEELGVRVSLGRFIGMYLGGYHFQGENVPVLDCFWLASIVDGQVRPNPEEASGYDWLPLRDPPPLAFATAQSAIRDTAGLVGLS